MTSYVLDASAYDKEVGTPLSLFAPEIIDLEVAALLRKQTLRGVLGQDQASEDFSAWARNSVQRVPHRFILEAVWALRHNITPHDASYVALAMALQIPLITADLRLAAAADRYCEIVAV